MSLHDIVTCHGVTHILKFSEVIPSVCPGTTYNNLEKFDDKVVIIRGIPQLEYKIKLKEAYIEIFFEKIKKYEVIVFDVVEHIWIDSWIDLLKMLNDSNKIIIITTFSIGIRFYINNIIPNNRIYFQSVEKLLHEHLGRYDKPFIGKLDLLKKRQYLLKCFSFNRSPHRDYVFDFLFKNKLIDGNNLSFHNHPFKELNDNLDFKKASQSYCNHEVDDLLKDVDLKRLNNLRIIPNSENFDIHDSNKQIVNNSIASVQSYFEITTEAQVPFSNDPSNSLYYTHSISRRTVSPILFGNVFHIMPNSKLFEDELTNAGFQLFFKDDEDFLNNLNEEFYFKPETQYKIKHNYKVLSRIYSEYNESKNFILEKIEEIYSIKF